MFFSKIKKKETIKKNNILAHSLFWPGKDYDLQSCPSTYNKFLSTYAQSSTATSLSFAFNPLVIMAPLLVSAVRIILDEHISRTLLRCCC